MGTEDGNVAIQSQEETQGESTTPVGASNEKAEQALTPEEVKKQLAELTSQVKAFQSRSDKSDAEAKRLSRELAETKRAKKALESTLKGLSGDYGDEPDFGQRLEQHQLRSKLQTFEEKEAAEREITKAEIAGREFIQDTADMIRELGVDPADKRLGNAVRVAGVRQGDLKGLRSVLIKEATKLARGESGNMSEVEELKAKIANLEKAMGKGSDSYSAPSGGSHVNTYTREQIARMPQTEYELNREVINEALKSGRIK